MLPDLLAHRILRLIAEGGYQPGDRLPTIADLASRFEAARGTVREALVKLQTVGVLEVRHGSGIYVRRAGIADAANAERSAGYLPGTPAPGGGRGEAGMGASSGGRARGEEEARSGGGGGSSLLGAWTGLFARGDLSNRWGAGLAGWAPGAERGGALRDLTLRRNK